MQHCYGSQKLHDCIHVGFSVAFVVSVLGMMAAICLAYGGVATD